MTEFLDRGKRVSLAVIYFECREPSHLGRPSRRGMGGLTVHQRAWAYCDGSGCNEGHLWVATGGVQIGTLFRWQAAEAPAAKRAQAAEAPPSR